ncbi:MAG: gamma-glutamylcyclotransferase [Nostocales cyanobacterium]|nr:MAG: gamma-glutamylcyclotransferase [Nostocales cyanobacterium]TAF21928.1 MAG: gamma-glutamylcyclotransferase [Nostocales cyanobacterium]
MNVFVYGTLKPGESNYYLCENYVISAKQAIANGKLYHLPEDYPAMTPGDDQIQGYLLSFPDSQVLPILDDLEDYHPTRSISENLYYRQYIEVFEPSGVFLAWAWVYLMTPERVTQLSGIPQFNGCWTGDR